MIFGWLVRIEMEKINGTWINVVICRAKTLVVGGFGSLGGFSWVVWSGGLVGRSRHDEILGGCELVLRRQDRDLYERASPGILLPSLPTLNS